MTNDDIQAAWNSPANQPSATDTARLISELFRRVRRRRLWEKAWLVWSVIALAGVTLLAGWALMRGASTPDWLISPLLIAPWFVILVSWRSRMRRALPTETTQGIQAALRTAQTENGAERRRLRMIAGLLAVTVPLLAVAMWRLGQAGKMAPHELQSMAVVFSLALSGGAGAVAWRYFRVLTPESRRLAALLQAYGET